MNKLQNFGPVYLINLPDQTKRLNHIKKEFNTYGITDYKIVEAVDGRTDDLKGLIHGNYPKLRSTEIGCIASHIKAIKTWLEDSDDEYAIIMEDDCSFENVQYWSWTWDDFMKNIPEDADIIQLVMLKEDNLTFSMHVKEKYNHKDYFSYAWSTACYVIKRSYAEKLIKTLVIDGKYELTEGKYKNKPADVILYNLGHAYTMPILTHFIDTKHAINLSHAPFHNRSKKQIDSWWQKYADRYTKESFFDVNHGLKKIKKRKKDLNLAFKVFHVDGKTEVLRKREILTNRANEKLSEDFSMLETPTIVLKTEDDVKEFFKDEKIKFDPAGWNGRGWRIGEFAIWASNFTAWKNFYKTDHDMLMLIEDDIVLSKNFNDKLIDYIDELPSDWDFFTVYYPPTGNDRYDKERESLDVGQENICRVYQSWSCLCYIVSKQGAKKLLQQVKNNVNGPIDHWLFYNKNLNGYAIKLDKDNICNIHKMESTVQFSEFRNMEGYV
jgi:GR25 family glycosyltransferase involved in LPS biosynthesis